MSQLTICLIIFVLTVAGYVSGKFNLSIVAITSLVALSVTGCLSAKEAVAYFGNNNVIMIAGMCIVAVGFNKTRFCTTLAEKIAGMAKGSVAKMMFGYVLVGSILSQFIQSPVIAFSIVAPMLMASAESMGLKPSKVVFPVGIATVVTCCTLPVGAGATVPDELNGYLEAYYSGLGATSPHTIEFLQPMIARLPLLVIAIIYFSFFAIKIAPDEAIVESSSNKSRSLKSKEPLKPFQEYAGVVIFFVDAVLLMFSSTFGLANWQATLIGALAMVFCGVLSPKESFDAIPLPMLLMIVGALSMAGALGSTGAGELVGSYISKVVESTGGNSYITGFIFFIIPFLLTQVMSNRATMLIFHPIAIATCASANLDPRGLMILIQAACLSAFITPMATQAIPVIMDYGGYDQKSMIKQGLPIAIICAVVSVGWIMTFLPL